MPATEEERLRVAYRLSRMELAADAVEDIVWADGERITQFEQADVFMRAYATIRSDRQYLRAAQRRALRLLPTLLSQEQRRQLRNCRYFYVQCASGAVYRLHPHVGMTRAVTRHNTRWYETRSFCLHDYPRLGERQMPPADLCIAHLLWLLTDEAAFLEAANATPVRPPWDGDWRRRLNAARRERAGQGQDEGTGQ